MSDDISHKKAMNILDVLSDFTGMNKDFFDEEYKKLRNKGYTRIEAVRTLWEDKAIEWFYVIDGMLVGRPQRVKSMISYISSITRHMFSEDDVRKEYSELSLLLGGDTSLSLEKTFYSIMDKYFEYLVGRDDSWW